MGAGTQAITARTLQEALAAAQAQQQPQPSTRADPAQQNATLARNRQLLLQALQPWQSEVFGASQRMQAPPGTKPGPDGRPVYPQRPGSLQGSGFVGGLAQVPNWAHQYVR